MLKSACCSILRVAFLAFFILRAFNDLQHAKTNAKELAKNYAVFDEHTKKLTGHSLPGYLSSSFVAKHAEEVVHYSMYAQLTFGFLAIFVPCFTPLAALFESFKTFVNIQGGKFFFAKHPLPDYEPLFLAVALFAASFLFSCSGKKCENKKCVTKTHRSHHETEKEKEKEKVEKKEKNRNH